MGPVDSGHPRDDRRGRAGRRESPGRSPLSAQEQAGPLTIQGRVVNGTEGGDPVEGLPVVFHQNSVDMLNESRTAAGPDGGFIFRDIIYDPDIAYGVSVIYKGALYGG